MTAVLEAEDDEEALAETCLRRLANRHGHWRVHYQPCGCRREVCRDYGGHNRDVALMTMLLQMADLAPYESMPRTDVARGTKKLTTSYMPPGRR